MTNYTRGRSREYKTMQILREKGWFCSRSAMSHGPVDVFAAKGGRILLIQVKSGSAVAKKIELDLLKKWAIAFDAMAEVWSFKRRGKLEKLVIRAKMEKSSKRLVTTAQDMSKLLSEKVEVMVPAIQQKTIPSADEIVDPLKILPP